MDQSGAQRREAALAEVESGARVSRKGVWQVATELGPWRVVVRPQGPTCPETEWAILCSSELSSTGGEQASGVML